MSALPVVLLPYQQRFLEALTRERVVVVEKSRRTGFSWAAAFAATLDAAQASGRDAFYMSYNLEMAREFIGYVARFARLLQAAAEEVQEFVWLDPEKPDRAISAYRVSFASGHKVVALPSVPRSLRGMQGLVIIDEAAYHDKLEEVLRAAMAMLMWGGAVALISTHNGDDNFFATVVHDIRAGRRPYHLLRVTLDDALAEGLYRRICLVAGEAWSAEKESAWRDELIAFYGDGAAQELFVVPSPSRGAYLPAALLEARMEDGVPVVRHEAESGFETLSPAARTVATDLWCAATLEPLLGAIGLENPVSIGEDFARKGDLTVIWVLAVERDLRRRTVLVVELRNVPFEQQRQILFYIADRLRLRALAADATGNGAYLAEVAAQRYGARVVQVTMSEGWYREQMPPFKAALEDGMLTLPRDRDILGDLRALELVRGVARVPERTRGADGQQRHGDAAIACALAYAASRAEVEIYAYDPVRAPERAEARPRWRERPNEEEEDLAATREGREPLPALRGGWL